MHPRCFVEQLSTRHLDRPAPLLRPFPVEGSPREGAGQSQGEEESQAFSRASARPSTLLEPVGHLLRRAVERAHRRFHPAASVWTGTCWSWLKVRITRRAIPAGVEVA